MSAFLWWKGQSRYRSLCLLLGLTLAVELTAEFLIAAKVDFTWLYHIFVVVEYSLVCVYFLQLMEARYRKIILFSIPVFACVSLGISHYMYNFRSFPGMNINTEGFLVCLVSSYSLLNLPEAKEYNRVVKHPDFWITVGWMIFFAGTFFSNGLYSYLYGLNREQALELFALVNKPLNLVLYSCLTIGFICAALPKYFTRSS